MKTRVFISYASKNKEVADSVCEELEKNGESCWIAPRNIPPGAPYGEEIIKGLDQSDAFILILSQASNESQHVLREVERAVNRKLPLFVVAIEECQLSKSMEYFLLTNQWLDAKDGVSGKLGPLCERLAMLQPMAKDTGKDTFTADTSEDDDFENPSKSKTWLGLVIGAVLALVVLAIVWGAIANSHRGEEAISQGAQTPEMSDSSTPAGGEISQNSGDISTDLNDNTEEASTESASTNAAELPTYQVGEFLMFGRYYPKNYAEENNDGELKWQIIDIYDDGKTLRLITEQIIDIKPYDCAESGYYGKDSEGNEYDSLMMDSYSDQQKIEFFGNCDWEKADLRAWLNASGPVKYQSPSQADNATDEFGNGFGSQSGFLTSFRNDEIAMIEDYVVDDAITDKVTLLATFEVDAYCEQPTFILCPTVTKSAIASDDTSWYNTYEGAGCTDYLWVTRTPWEPDVSQIMAVETSMAHERYTSFRAAASGFGIRPVIMIDVSNLTPGQVSGEGSNFLPYQIRFEE